MSRSMCKFDTIMLKTAFKLRTDQVYYFLPCAVPSLLGIVVAKAQTTQLCKYVCKPHYKIEA